MTPLTSPKKLSFILLTSLFLFLHYSSSHPSQGGKGYTGAPQDGICLNCHNTGSINGNIEVSGIPATVDAGLTYPLTVTINNTVGTAVRAGFQMVTLNDNGDFNAGAYTVPASESNAVVKPIQNRSYVGHEGAKTFNGNTSVVYEVEWTAPTDQNGGDITFYAAALLGNGSGFNGDRFTVYTQDAMISGGGADPISLSFDNVQGVSCASVDDGSATVVAMGGDGNYNYDWDNGELDATAVALSAGIHQVTVSDNSGESEVGMVTINDAPAINISIDFTNNVSCAGENDGSGQVSATGGTGNITFQWEGIGNGAFQNNLPADSYIVIATDDNGCTNSTNVDIVEPAPIIPSIAFSSDPTCIGSEDGVIEVQHTGGTGTNFTYAWTPDIGFQNGSAIFDVGSGTYTLEITDENGCTATLSETLSDPQELTIDITNIQNESCDGENDGSATVSAQGGTGTITYLWDNGFTGTNQESLPPTTYLIIATDANGCTADVEVSIEEGPELEVELITIQSPTCGMNSGSLEVSVLQASGSVTYVWSTGETSATIANLSVGSYSVTVTSGACDIVESTNLQEVNTLDATLQSSTNVLCNGASTGSATISVSGGSPDYDIIWPDGLSTESRSDLAADTYIVTITDAQGCIDMVIVIISEPSAIMIDNADISPSGCSSVTPAGSISISASGGTGNLSYLWDNGEITSTIDGLTDGVYALTITDENSCTLTYSGVVQSGNDLEVSSMLENLSCNGIPTGSISISVTGGQSPYAISWEDDDNETDLLRTGLSAGTYSYTVTDNQDCTFSESVELTEPSMILANISFTDETALDANDGTATVSPSGGNPGYDFLWSTGASSNMISSLAPGPYTVTVTDSNGCFISESVNIAGFGCDLAATITTTDVACFGGDDGSAVIVVESGSPPYNFLWSTGSMEDSIANLVSGDYAVTISDASNCSLVAMVTVLDGLPIIVTGVITNTVVGNSNGAVDIIVTGGNEGYTYLWSNEATTEDIENLDLGDYSVTVTDSEGCTGTETFSVQEEVCSDSVLITAAAELVCFGKENGSLTASLISEEEAAYVWSNDSVSATIVDLLPGVYSVTATTSSGCLYTTEFTLVGNPEITVSNVQITNESSAGAEDGAISIDAAGGTGSAYVYQWFSGMDVISTEADLSNVSAGMYDLCIEDELGCTNFFGPFEVSVSTSVENDSLFDLEVFPNPVTNILSISNSQNIIQDIVLMNINGEKVNFKAERGKDMIQIHTKYLPTGNYILKISSANDTRSQLISVMH